MAESFFSALKNEWLNRMAFAIRTEACQAVLKYIDGSYNRKRIHSGPDYKAQPEDHTEYVNRQLAA